MRCNVCQGTGFVNLHQIPETVFDTFSENYFTDVLLWIKENPNYEVAVCDCCGDNESWYGIPGQHYSSLDPSGTQGVYAYNGGYAKCH